MATTHQSPVKDPSLSDDNHNDVQQHKYVCIHCGYPTTSLYRLLVGNHIKLIECKNCHQDVDPYIEREILLVIIDLILLRSSAYKHITFNRQHSSATICSCSLILTVFTTFLRLASLTEGQLSSSSSQGIYYSSEIVHSVGNVILQLTSQVVGTSIFAILVLTYLPCTSQIVITSSSTSSSSVTTRSKMKRNTPFLRSISIAILAPYLFSVVTYFIYIYEPSATVRQLGRLFIVISQYIGVQSVITCFRQSTLSSIPRVG